MKYHIHCRVTIFLLVIMVLLPFTGTASAQSALDNVRKSTVKIAWGISENHDAWREFVRRPDGTFNPMDLMMHMGTGFMVGDDPGGEFRYCITNWHVVNLDWLRTVQAELGIAPTDPLYLEPEDITIYIYRSRDDFVEARVRYELFASDIAVLEIAPFERSLYGYEALEFGHSGMVGVGDDICVVGFPGAAEGIADLTAAYLTDLTVTKGIISRIVTVEGVLNYNMDAVISGGNSGGPVVNKDGVIIGVATRMAGQLSWDGGAIIPANINQAVAIDAVTELLRSRNIPFVEAAAAVADPVPDLEPEPEPEPEPEMIVLAQMDPPRFSSDGILSWSGISDASGYEVTLFHEGQAVSRETVGPGSTRLDFKDSMQDMGPGTYSATVKPLGGGLFQDGPTSSASNPFEQKGGISPLLIGGGAAAVLLIVVLIIAFMMMGKKRQVATAPSGAAGTPAPPRPSLSPAQQASITSAAPASPVTRAKQESPGAGAPVTKAKQTQPRAVLKGVSGYFAGKTIELVEGQLVIGRDPRMAQLVYPQANEEISRKHCTVRFDERSQKFAIEDSSSNGTFLSSNEKLEPGKTYFLNSGERFYLADPKEVFEVKME